jgi:hypothetical protein
LKASRKSTNNPLEALNSIESILDKNPEDENALSFKANLNQTLRKKNTGYNCGCRLVQVLTHAILYAKL